jgi:hypothetical protein
VLARSIVALWTASAVLTAPTIAQLRTICRITGEEMRASECPGEAATSGEALLAACCCEHRLRSPLEPASFESPPPVAAPATVAAIEVPFPLEAPPTGAIDRSRALSSRPPLSATRILLI